jgi:hypothetical protein
VWGGVAALGGRAAAAPVLTVHARNKESAHEPTIAGAA